MFYTILSTQRTVLGRPLKCSLWIAAHTTDSARSVSGGLTRQVRPRTRPQTRSFQRAFCSLSKSLANNQKQSCQESRTDICTAHVSKHNCNIDMRLFEISTLPFDRFWIQLTTPWKQQTFGNKLVVSICGSLRSAYFLSDDSDLNLLLQIKIKFK